MRVETYIAWRYLFARKSHNVINIISAISAIGMAIGTAALVLILSIYNGFDNIINENMSDLDPDVLLVSADGSKHFFPDEQMLEMMSEDPRMASISDILEDNVFITYGESQGIARAKGVDRVYEDGSLLAAHCVEGQFSLHHGEILQAAVGSTLARSMGIHPRFLDPLTIYYPDRDGHVSPSNPSGSLHRVDVRASCVISISSNVDEDLLIVPVEVMRTLIGSRQEKETLAEEVSGVEIRLHDTRPGAVKKFISDYSTQRFKLMSRYQQHPELYKMMRYEKFAIYMILIFVVIIIALNIFGSLSMLIIEKRNDIGTLKAMGASDGMVRRIFVTEGWLISLLGLVSGLVAGIILSLLQQQLGLIKMPGGFAMEAYPVILDFSDIIATILGVGAVGLVVALAAAGKNNCAS